MFHININNNNNTFRNTTRGNLVTRDIPSIVTGMNTPEQIFSQIQQRNL